jgi:hypothetical protein
MAISPELLVQITQSIARTHGEDIAQDVAVLLLRRRGPLRKPVHWARAYAAGLARREKVRLWKVRVFTDVPKVGSAVNGLPNGEFADLS